MTTSFSQAKKKFSYEFYIYFDRHIKSEYEYFSYVLLYCFTKMSFGMAVWPTQQTGFRSRLEVVGLGLNFFFFYFKNKFGLFEYEYHL